MDVLWVFVVVLSLLAVLACAAAAVVFGWPALTAWWRHRGADRHVVAVTRPTRHVAPGRRHA